MAIVVAGMTCSRCGLPLEGRELVIFPAFVANRADPLWRFSDSVFHRECLELEPLATLATTVSEEVIKAAAPPNRKCAVCGALITIPDDYFFLGYLTFDRQNPLFEFNYIHLHQSHIDRWRDRDRLIGLLQSAGNNRSWIGESLNWLLTRLREPRNHPPGQTGTPIF